MASTKEPSPPVDGRRARADHTRDAIVDALLGLLEEGVLRPSADRIAERAGVSRRALFNHFTDLEDLLSRAAARRYEKVRAILPSVQPGGTRGERALAFCGEFTRFYEQTASPRRAAGLVAHESPVIAAQLAEAARLHRRMVETVFAKELDAAPAEARATLIAGIAAATSFAMREELRIAQGLSVEDTKRTMVELVMGLLSGSARASSKRKEGV